MHLTRGARAAIRVGLLGLLLSLAACSGGDQDTQGVQGIPDTQSAQGLVSGEAIPITIPITAKLHSTVEVPVRFKTPLSGLGGYELHIFVPDDILMASFVQPQWSGLLVEQGRHNLEGEDGSYWMIVADLGKRWGANQDITLTTLRLIPDNSGVVRVSIPKMDDDSGNPIMAGDYLIVVTVE